MNDPELVYAIQNRLREKYNLPAPYENRTTPSLSWWQKPFAWAGGVPVLGEAMRGVGQLFEWINYPWEEIALPTLMAPFTPATRGTEGKNWLQREREEYHEWESPKYVKGAMELLNPTYLIPAGVAVKGAGGLAKLAGAAKLGTGLSKVGAGISAVESAPARMLEKALKTSFAVPERALPMLTRKVNATSQERLLGDFLKDKYNIKVVSKSEPKFKEMDSLAVYEGHTGEIFVKDRFSQDAFHEIGHKVWAEDLIPKETKAIFEKEYARSNVPKGVKNLDELQRAPYTTPMSEWEKTGKFYFAQPRETWAQVFQKVMQGKEVAQFPETTIAIQHYLDRAIGEYTSKAGMYGVHPGLGFAGLEGLKFTGEGVVKEVPLTGLRKLKGLFATARKDIWTREAAVSAERYTRESPHFAYRQKLLDKGISQDEARRLADIKFPRTGEFENKYVELALTEEEKAAFNITSQEANDIVEYLYKFEYPKLGWTYPNDRAVDAFRRLVVNDGKHIIPTKGEMKLLEDALGREWTSAAVSAARKGKLENLLDIANLPRAVIASWDFSAPFRQGMILTARMATQGRFKEIGKAFGDMFSAFALEKNAVLIDRKITSGARFAKRMQQGLEGYHAPLDGTLRLSEEMFTSQASRHIPLVRRSERAFITFLNSARDSYYNYTMDTWEYLLAKGELKGGILGRTAITEITDNDIKGLNQLINYSTGRGNLGALEKGNIGPILNTTLFSPRLLISRLQWPNMIRSNSPLVRKEAARQIVAFCGIGAGLLGMAKAAGAEISLDPRSSEFGKIKIGDTRLDIWTGYAQYSRFAAQVLGGQRKNQLGEVYEADRTETIWRFAQSKFSPAVGLVADILQGESYMGEEMNLEADNLSKQAFNRLIPLFVQDLVEAIKAQGPLGGLIATPGAFGVGVITYSNEELIARQKLTEQFNIPEESWYTREIDLAKQTLEPYYAITENYWSQYPELEAIADQIKFLEKTNPRLAEQILSQYPQILEIRAAIARDKKLMLTRYPEIQSALTLVNR